jgi:hypothetical protein
MLVANNHKTRLACLNKTACRILQRDKKTYLGVAVSYACKLFITFALILNVNNILLALIKPKLASLNIHTVAKIDNLVNAYIFS